MARVAFVEGRVRGLGDEDAALPPPQARQVHELLVALAARDAKADAVKGGGPRRALILFIERTSRMAR